MMSLGTGSRQSIANESQTSIRCFAVFSIGGTATWDDIMLAAFGDEHPVARLLIIVDASDGAELFGAVAAKCAEAVWRCALSTIEL